MVYIKPFNTTMAEKKKNFEVIEESRFLSEIKGGNSSCGVTAVYQTCEGKLHVPVPCVIIFNPPCEGGAHRVCDSPATFNWGTIV